MIIKEVEFTSRLFDFLTGIVRDYGLYIFIGLVYLLIPFLAWVLSGGLRRTLLKAKPVPEVSPTIVVQIPIGRPAPTPEPFSAFPPSSNPSPGDNDNNH